MAIVATAASAFASRRLRRRARRSVDRRVRCRRVHRARRALSALRSEIAVLRPREIVVASGYDVASAIPEITQIGRADHRDRRLALRARVRAPDAARSVARAEPRRIWPRAPPGRGVRRRRAGPASSRHAEGRARARAQHPAAPVVGRPADRSDHAQASRDRAGDGRRPRADRCSTRSIARSRRWGAGCSARGCFAR